jgi:hypothetical protein
MTINQALQDAAANLPVGWELQVCVEKGAAWIHLYDPDGESVNFDSSPDRTLAEQIQDAICEAGTRAGDADSAPETFSAPQEQVECPNCFGEGAIAMSTGYERRICELCQGSGKTLVRRCARCKALLHVLNTSDTCSDCSL